MSHKNMFLLYLLSFSSTLFAQTQANTGQIEGIITDRAQSAVPNAAVQVRNTDTNFVRELVTNASGFFRASLVPIGKYEVRAQASGFAPHRQTGIELSTGQIVSLQIALELASVQQEITVTAETPLIETAQTSTSRAVNEMDIENLPNLSRSELNFAFLQPFTNGNRPREYEAPRIDIGGLSRRLNYQVDGFQNSSTQQKAFRVIIFSPAALQETQILSFGAPAENGRTGGGVVNNIIKSGTNQFHGLGHWLTSREVWNARPFGSQSLKPSGNVFAGAAGGPIRKDRLFFFFSYEASKRAFPQSLGFTSPIAKENAARLGLTAKEVDVLPASFNPQLWLLKLDWRPSSKHSFSLRGNTFREYFYARDPGGLTVFSSSNGAIFNEAAVAASWTSVLSPRLINEFRTQIADRFTRRRPTAEPAPATLPNTTVSGVATFGFPSGLTANREKIAEWSDNLSLQHRGHLFKTGMNSVFSPLTYEDQLIPAFTFGGLPAAAPRGAVTALDQYLYTREGRMDPAAGQPFTYTQLTLAFGERVLRYRQTYLGAYMQDQWKAGRSLTINWGLRWEGGVPAGGDPQAPYPLSQQSPSDQRNIAPRVGLAWAPRASTRTVLRASYGVHFDSPQGNYYRDALLNNARRQITVQVPGTSAGAPVYPNSPQFPGGLPTVRPSLNVLDPRLVWMYAQQVQIGVQRELARSLSLSVTYALLRATRIPVPQNINLNPSGITGRLADGRPIYSTARVNPLFNNIAMITAGGNSNYNGLGINLNKRFHKGFQFNLSYTWSHALDNAPETGISGGSEQPQDTFNRRAEYGNSLADVRHVLNGSAVWRLRRNQFAFFFFARSGSTFDVRAGTDLNRDSVNNDRPPYFGRNTGKGPATAQLDVRYSRFVPLGEKRRLEFTAEAANLLNSPLADSTNAFINRTYGTGATPLASFGSILAYHEMRRLQLGVKFSF
ncbi:MAG: TonB-dependent receptor [Acidobacteria bacterium]|nr:TonB-dependent receptor [Acidobacteriota bacterium]